MEIYFLGAAVISVCFFVLGIGVWFFGLEAVRGECGKVPSINPDECLTGKAGLCPFDDKSGTMKLAHQARITFPRK